MSDAIAQSGSVEQHSPRERARELLERLIQAYPGVFFAIEERRVKPLKVGIHKDLIPIIKEWGYQVAVLKYTLGGYTRQLRYQLALLKNPQRIDLQGEPAGDITAAHREMAQEKVRLIKEKRRQNQQPEKPQLRRRQPKAPNSVSAEAIDALQKKLNRKAAS